MQRDSAGVKGRYHHVPAYQPQTLGPIFREYVFDQRFWQSCFLRSLVDPVFAVTVSRVGWQAAECKACFVDQLGNAGAGGYESSTSAIFLNRKVIETFRYSA